MHLSREAIQILKVLAEERENNPETRVKGIPQRALGARIGAYLNNVMYPVSELIDAGLVSRVHPLDVLSSIVITEKGYRYITPFPQRGINWLRKHQLVALISIIVSLVGILVGLLNLLKK